MTWPALAVGALIVLALFADPNKRDRRILVLIVVLALCIVVAIAGPFAANGSETAKWVAMIALSIMIFWLVWIRFSVTLR